MVCGHFPLTFAGRFGMTPGHESRPVIPNRRQDAFDDPAFLFEVKYDGFRALADTIKSGG